MRLRTVVIRMENEKKQAELGMGKGREKKKGKEEDFWSNVVCFSIVGLMAKAIIWTILNDAWFVLGGISMLVLLFFGLCFDGSRAVVTSGVRSKWWVWYWRVWAISTVVGFWSWLIFGD